MDSLKTVAEKVKRSPQVIRRKLGSTYDKVHSNKHEELREDWLHQPEPLNDGVPFYVKWLGTRQVYKSQGSGCTDAAVKKIVEEAKRVKKSRDESRLQKVLLTVATKNLTIEDMETKEVKLEVPIYRVSYCTADPNFHKVFAFILREKNAKDLYCHALLCSKESMAQAISLTVADAFSVAYESVQNTRRTIRQHVTNDVIQPRDHDSALSTKISAPCGTRDLNSNESHTGHLSDQGETDMTSSKSAKMDVTSSKSPINGSSGHGNPFNEPDVTSSDEFLGASGSAPFIQVTKDDGCERGIVNEGLETTSQQMKALDLAVDDDFDSEFTRLAESRSSTNLFETPIRRTDFQDDVTSLLATEQTANDLLKSRSAEDLLLITV